MEGSSMTIHLNSMTCTWVLSASTNTHTAIKVKIWTWSHGDIKLIPQDQSSKDGGIVEIWGKWLRFLKTMVAIVVSEDLTSSIASHWVSIRHPAKVWHYVTLFEKLGSKSLMGFCSLLWIVLSDQKNQKHTWYIFKEIVQLRSGKREGMCPTENQLAKFLKSWLSDSM